MNSIFYWHFHRIINLSVKDIDQNLSQHTERLPKMPQMDNVHGGIKLLEKLSPPFLVVRPRWPGIFRATPF